MENVTLFISVISTDGICAWCLYRVVQYYVGQKWRNLKAVAVNVPAEISRYGSIQLDKIPLEVWDFSTSVQHSTGLPNCVIPHKSCRSK